MLYFEIHCSITKEGKNKAAVSGVEVGEMAAQLMCAFQ
jgi:hypothetical protein